MAERGDARRKRRIDDDRRAEMLATIQEIVLDEGFAHLTVEELVSRLQCSKSTLYALSSSREVLVTTAVGEFFRSVSERVDERVADVADPAERISMYLTSLGIQMQRMSAACYQDMVAHDATRDVYAVSSAAAVRRVREFIRDGVESGQFRGVHAEFVAESVSLLIDGIQHGHLLAQTGLSFGDAYRELANFLVAGLINKSAKTAVPKPARRPR